MTKSSGSWQPYIRAIWLYSQLTAILRTKPSQVLFILYAHVSTVFPVVLPGTPVKTL